MRKALVIGASGSLGTVLTSTFAKHDWDVFSVDLLPCAGSLGGLSLNHIKGVAERQDAVLRATEQYKFNAIINVAGGFIGGGADCKNSALNSIVALDKCLASAVMTAHIAHERGQPNALLLFTGAASALHPTPSMLGYGMAKAAVHHLVRSLAADPSKLPKDCCVVGLCPTVLDTRANQLAAEEEGLAVDQFTPLYMPADLIVSWAEGHGRPASGSLVVQQTTKGKTSVEVVKL